MKGKISFGLMVAIYALVGVQLLAQTLSNAAMTGSVRDKTGAVLPGVTVTARNTGTNLTRSTLTNESGVYALPALPIGTYEVTCEFPGFQSQVRKDVQLQVGDNFKIDFNLEIGQISDTVTVTGEAPAIQSESAALGTVINNRTVLEMPLNGREFYALVTLVPGTVAPAPGSTLAFRGGVSVAGARDTSNAYTIDGIDNNSAGTDGPQLKIGVEFLQEFKVLTNSYAPDYGRGAGGQIVMTTRSGTNEYRGTLWNFFRHEKLDAKNFFDLPDCDKALPGQKCGPLAPLRHNQFGFAFGGPVPHIKNFYFFSGYEGLRESKSLTSGGTVPSPAFHNGDFSSLLPRTVRDPLSGQLFPGNIIPRDRWDPVGTAFVNLYPLPTNSAASRNLLSNPKKVHDNDQATLRLDYNFGKNNLYVRHLYNRELIVEAFQGRGQENGVPGFGYFDPLVGNTFTVGSALVYSPKLIGNIRYGMTRMWEPIIDANQVPFNKQVGLCCTDPGTQYWGRPTITASGYDTIGDNSGAPGARLEYIHEWNYTQSYLAGNHNLTMGYNFRLVKIDHFTGWSGRRGTFSFDGVHSGNAIADMLLGFPRSSNVTAIESEIRTHQRGRNHSWFFNDDWKVTSNLTVNLGFRYEINSPMFDADDRLASFNFATGKLAVPDPSKLLASVDPSIVEPSRYGRGIRNGDFNNINPRIGIAYTLDKKTVVRAGYGVFTDVLAFGNHLSSLATASPWFKTQTFTTDPTTGPVISLSRNPFPSDIFKAPLLSLVSIDPNFRDGYVQNWNLAIQRQLAKSWVLETAYMGSRGTHLVVNRNANQAFPIGGPLGSGSIQSRRPYPAFNTIRRLDSMGNSYFHSMQVKLERRFADGLSLLGNYLWSKSIDFGSSYGYSGDPAIQNSRSLADTRGVSDFDTRHRFVMSSVYELPLGASHRLLSKGILSTILGGWQMSGIFTLQTGRPGHALLAADNSGTAGGADRPNAIGNPNDGQKSPNSFWNKAAFVAPPPGTFGNAGRNTLIGPGMRALDFSIMKNFRIRSEEKRRVQFRAEAFNIFNHPIFGQPNGRFDTSNFGVIPSTLVNTTSRQIQLALKIFF